MSEDEERNNLLKKHFGRYKEIMTPENTELMNKAAESFKEFCEEVNKLVVSLESFKESLDLFIELKQR